MSVFRIQRKRLDSESKHKVHSEESKSYSKNVKNLTELLNSVRQKQQSHLQIKRRIFTLEQTEEDQNISKLKRISETYNVKTNRKESMRNSKISKNSLSGTKFFPMFSPGKNSDTKFHPYHGIQYTKSRNRKKLSEALKSQEKINMSEHKISLQKKKEKGKNEYISLNSSIVGKSTRGKVQSNRIVSEQKAKQLKQVFEEAMEYYKKKNSHKALIMFKECLKYDYENVDCLYHMGSCCLNMQNYEQSIKHLSQAKNLNPSYNKNIYLYLAISHKMLKDEEESLKILQQGVKIFPQFEEGYLYIGKIHLRQSKFDEAIPALEKCVEINSKNLIGKIILGDAYSLANQDLKAVDILKQVLAEDQISKLDLKTQISTHLKLIKLLISLENYQDESLKLSFSFIQEQNPTSPELAYYKSLFKYDTSPEMTPKELSQMKINIYFALNQLNTYQMTVECTKLLLKVYIDNKDFYGAEEALKRITQSDVKPEHLKQWNLVIEGANDIIKRKNQDGKEKILKCIKKLNSKRSKKPNAPMIESTTKDINYLKLQAFSFLAYSLYLEENFCQSLSIYQQIITNCAEQTYRSSRQTKIFQQKFLTRYEQTFKEIYINKTVLQAIVDHKVKNNFDEAKIGFQNLIKKRFAPETIFMWAINQISLLKKTQTDFAIQNQDAQSQNSEYDAGNKVYEGFDWGSFFSKLEDAQKISPNYSLIYFYHSLVLLYLQSNTEALKKVQTAIEKVEEPVSEYHFIEALCHYTLFEETRDIQYAFRGLQAIDKAIEIDSGIPQFYKERSKHLFCLGKYQDAIKDCEKCQEEGPDDEVKLLCMFYSYAACKYEKSETLLHELAGTQESEPQTKSKDQKKNSKNPKVQNTLLESSEDEQNQHKYKEFEQAVKFRLKKYPYTGFVGKLLIALTDETRPKLDKTYLKMIKDAIEDRNQYSEFTVYFMDLLMAGYFIQQNDFTTSLNYLFACLEEIQCIVDEKQSKMLENDDNESEDRSIKPLKTKMNDQIAHINTDNMLNEVKFNIVVVTMIKNREERMTALEGIKGSHKEKAKQRNAQEIYQESLTLIETFMQESNCEELIENLQLMKNLILKSEETSLKTQGNEQTRTIKESPGSVPVYLKPYPEIEKFSDELPYLVIPIGEKYILMTKLVIFYPVKLRFNIKPEFDPAFLFNFDIDKVDNKITPPWYKFSEVQTKGSFEHRIIFTDQLRNQSIAISSTQREPSIIDNRKSKHRYEKITGNESEKKMQVTKSIVDDKPVDFKQLMKLDSKIEKKLKKLFPK